MSFCRALFAVFSLTAIIFTPSLWAEPTLSVAKCNVAFAPSKALEERSTYLPQKLRIGSFNIARFAEKTPAAEKALAEMMRDGNADIWVIQEAETAAQLEDFVRRQDLSRDFKVHFAEDVFQHDTGVAFVYRSKLAGVAEFSDARAEVPEINHGTSLDPLFPKGLPIIKIIDPLNAGQVKMWIMGVHLKSKRGHSDGIRREQVNKISEALATLKKRLGERFAVVGDFNGHLPDGQEFIPLWRKGMWNPAEMQGEGVVTFVYFDQYNRMLPQQLDGVLLAPAVGDTDVSLRVVPMRDIDSGSPVQPPRRRKDREHLPSDHQPVVATVPVAA